jgi:hypothetical protein
MENQKIQIDLSQTPWVECKEGNKLFETKLMFKKVSALISPSGKEEHVPLEVVICSTCGKVPKFFYDKAKDVPQEMRSTCDEQKLAL